MDITRTPHAGYIDLAISGRLDSYWADHLDTAISEVIREGNDTLRLDLSQTSFLSSAGIAVLVKHYKQLVRLNGSLLVVKASEPVRFVLEMSRLTSLLCDTDAPAAAPAAPAGGRSIERAGAHFDIVELDPKGSLTCKSIGDPARLGAPGTDEGHEVTCRRSMFLLGIGSLGGPFEDCRERFGDLLAVGGAIVYQPADGTNVPDYMVAERAPAERGAAAPPAPEARMMYGLVCEGSFASLARFESTGGAHVIDLPTLAETCLEVAGAPAAGLIVVAEVAGLVGAALRQSPYALAGAGAAGGFFAHPEVRERLTFTAERAFARSVALVAGVVARPDAPGDHSQLRPIGGSSGLLAHFHAAAFPFLPLRKGRIDVHDTVTALFESERVLGVLHLLHDDRATNGAGANEFIRGACWTSPIRSWG